MCLRSAPAALSARAGAPGGGAFAGTCMAEAIGTAAKLPARHCSHAQGEAAQAGCRSVHLKARPVSAGRDPERTGVRSVVVGAAHVAGGLVGVRLEVEGRQRKGREGRRLRHVEAGEVVGRRVEGPVGCARPQGAALLHAGRQHIGGRRCPSPQDVTLSGGHAHEAAGLAGHHAMELPGCGPRGMLMQRHVQPDTITLITRGFRGSTEPAQ